MVVVFIALLALSLISTLLYLKTSTGVKYRLDVLALISGSASLMFLVDFVYSYVEGEGRLELNLDITVLSTLLVLVAVMVWLLFVLVGSIKH